MVENLHRSKNAVQVSSLEVAEAATGDAVDQFCWTVAQTIRRILGLAPSRADEIDVHLQKRIEEGNHVPG